jgi:hypothetical protein
MQMQRQHIVPNYIEDEHYRHAGYTIRKRR